jgi:hypothetical protein
MIIIEWTETKLKNKPIHPTDSNIIVWCPFLFKSDDNWASDKTLPWSHKRHNCNFAAEEVSLIFFQIVFFLNYHQKLRQLAPFYSTVHTVNILFFWISIIN